MKMNKRSIFWDYNTGTQQAIGTGNTAGQQQPTGTGVTTGTQYTQSKYK